MWAEGPHPSPGMARYMWGRPGACTGIPVLLGLGGPVGPGISQKHSTVQMGGSLCGSQALMRQAGARELGGGSPSAVTSRAQALSLQGSLIAGSTRVATRAVQGRPAAGASGAWMDPLGLTKPVPQAFRLEPWASGSRPNLSSRAEVASVALLAVL